MTAAEKVQKMAQIRALKCPEEIKGWRLGIRLAGRGPFDGELAALAEREKQIKGGR
mgnify:CR=1 FL=1